VESHHATTHPDPPAPFQPGAFQAPIHALHTKRKTRKLRKHGTNPRFQSHPAALAEIPLAFARALCPSVLCATDAPRSHVPLSERNRQTLSTRRACLISERIATQPRGLAQSSSDASRAALWAIVTDHSPRRTRFTGSVPVHAGQTKGPKSSDLVCEAWLNAILAHPTLFLLPRLLSGTPAEGFGNDLACRIPQQRGDLHVRIKAEDLSGHDLALGYRHTADEPFQLGNYRRTDGQCA
jgi:hypothetical protein